jgi:coenzyme F420-0:L-glutamate ligase
MMSFSAYAVPGLPEVQPHTDLADLISVALQRAGKTLQPFDIVVVAQKVVSKAEGCLARLEDFIPSPRALQLATATGKDARKIEAILSQSTQILRAVKIPPEGLIIARHNHGWICANAAIDESNVGPGSDAGLLLMLPEDPDRSARAIRETFEARFQAPIGVVITDTFGRPWRQGLVNVAIGVAGVPVIDDWVGRTDAYGRTLHATQPAFADEISASAGLLMGKDRCTPVVVLQGLSWTDQPAASAREILRPMSQELFT